MAPVTLDFKSLTYSPSDAPLFTGFSLTLQQHRVGVVGRNGAGKSQLLRLAAGLIAPDQGEVRLEGVDIARQRARAIELVGVIFQNPDHQIIFPTVDEEMGFGLRHLPKAEAEARIDAVLAQFQRQPWRGRAVQSLSHGQKQLLCLMAVIAMQPKLIVLDEPTSGLDLVTRLRLLRVLRDLPQDVLHVTHDLEALAGYDRVIWLDRGQVLLDGPPNTVLPAYIADMQERADAEPDH
ncbi:energy-coupling factor ABC transporter ATP-binding protein [Ketogulonicigenium vulgare]|uniref:ABC transporter, ATPase subunit n=1 Tax=Ketogulonicigenium vulgare (strain WSH-001) TaxID=759362 RepID=F9Y3D0_KETVW|nr:ABC transporter ATP-binding protein [Ketogulonicigenium vulgare]ADO42166.1 ABC transporter, ATPase subunit [Ketogulonicigenium vulgare Y25]AEM40371.1 ABC transporter, ATPase subunit [Ketogulonicigenium vulgare WSH-001]ALJ80560.1 cobalt ABC transporter [Ketogulonicigenium vulgare]ANW33381.1 cobalt ABC transporter [Ketogulonicigenium vulgare]AOZ54084.1 ABC transporter ATPase subunit [Ketogulonicigenium vulgare]